jgi:AcrR family transcriptional regulator
MRVFWEHGYEGASIADLTKAMGINPPSLYSAFGCKEELFREAVAFYDENDGSITARALGTQATARAAIEAMLRQSADAYTDPARPSGCLIVLGANTWTSDNREIRRFLADMRHNTVELIRRRMQRGVDAGELAPETDIGSLAAFYNTVLEGLSLDARSGASRRTLHGIVDWAMASWDTERPRT